MGRDPSRSDHSQLAVGAPEAFDARRTVQAAAAQPGARCYEVSAKAGQLHVSPIDLSEADLIRLFEGLD